MDYMFYIAIVVMLPTMSQQACPKGINNDCHTHEISKICQEATPDVISAMIEWSGPEHSQKFECNRCTIPTFESQLLPTKWNKLTHINIHDCLVPLQLLDNTFANVGHTVENVWLRACKISQLPVHIFSRMPKLWSLTLADNEITELPGLLLTQNAALGALDVSDNRVTIITKNMLQHTPKLVRLDLSRNYITYLAKDTFTHTPNLAALQLSGNPMLDIDIFRVLRLTNLGVLHMNDWPCRTLEKLSQSLGANYDIESLHIQKKGGHQRVEIGPEPDTALAHVPWWKTRLAELGDITCMAMDKDFRSLKFDAEQTIRMQVDEAECARDGGAATKRFTVADVLRKHAERLHLAVRDLGQVDMFSQSNKCYRVPMISVSAKMNELSRITDKVLAYSQQVTSNTKNERLM